MALNLMSMELVSCFIRRGSHIDVYRDRHGKFYVRNEGTITQRRLTANEVVRYLSHVANDV